MNAAQDASTRAITGGRCNDLIVWSGGSGLMMVRPVSEAGKAWLDEPAPDDAQFLGESMAVEHRYIEGVVNAAREAGLEVA